MKKPGLCLKAEKVYEKFKALAIEKGSKDDEIYAINALGRLYYSQENYSQSKVAYDTILQFEQSRNNPQGVIDASNNLGNVYEAINDSTGAFQMYNQSLQLANDIGDVEKQPDLLEQAYQLGIKVGTE